ncbi:glycosyltransferase family 39 protein [Glaciibacter superstes]|uniref:glycosyltransferase family 39 protein n=1 Tax=Glaciibacter superstes TaxID=501023 RepID=UPI0003B353AE|nr:glycosyltransferase family 39 protein [Glaciibacter superstes]
MTSVLAPPVTGVLPEPRQGTARSATLPPVLVGAVAFVISAAASWQPSYWGDEAASVMSAQRSLGSLFNLLGHIDAVHGTYYLFLHFWIEAFGASEFSTRLPSAIAVGIAAAGIVVLVRTLINPRVAVIAGLVFAVLPRVTYMGAEARSMAIATAIGVWLTVLLVHVLRSAPPQSAAQRRVRLLWWTGYAVLLSFGIYMFLYVALLIPAHAVTVLLMNRKREALFGWTASVAAGLVLAIPVLWFGAHERQQIAFIGRRPDVSLTDAAVHQWFGNRPLAVAAWALIALAVVVVAVGVLRHRREYGRSATTSTATTLIIALAWMLIPSAILFLGTRFLTPMYSLRYLSICAPAAAIAIAIGIASFRSRWLRISALLLVVVLAVPTYLSQRGEFGKNFGSDWRQAADVIAQSATDGDAVVFDESNRPSRNVRLAMHLYPDAFTGLKDVTLASPYQENDGLWDRVAPLEESTNSLVGTNRVWLLQYSGSSEEEAGTDVATLKSLGFTESSVTLVNRTTITEMTR